MAYNDTVAMARSQSLMQRVAACAAEQGVESPNEWALAHAWGVAAAPGWGDKWASARAVGDPNANPDTGARTDVIADADILAVVQQLLATG